MGKIEIKLSALDEESNFRIHSGVMKYFEELIEQEIIQRTEQLQKLDWTCWLVIYQQHNPKMAKTLVAPPNYRQVKADNIRIYEMVWNTKELAKLSGQAQYEELLKGYAAIIAAFFEAHFKRVYNARFPQFLEMIDFDYLASLPYPAQPGEQYLYE